MDIDMSTLRLLERERDIPVDVLIPTIEQALLLAYMRSPGAIDGARAEVERRSGHVTIWAPELDEEDRRIGEFDDTPSGFGRIAAATARQVILQKLRDVEDDNVLGHFKGREGELVSGQIQQGNNPKMVQVNLGTVEGLLPPHEQVPGETYRHGDRIRAFVVEAKRGFKGPSITLSRSHPGSRVRAVMNELGDEKIDIIDFSEDPAEFILNALSPARVSRVVVLDEAARSARAVVPDAQLSLAIGKEGQNARLAARLTGWKIDIVPESRATDR